MKYCVNYSNQSKVLDKVDEIRVYYTNYEDIIKIVEFCKTHPEQTIIISIIEEPKDIIKNKTLKTFFAIAKENPELKIKIELPKYDDELIDFVKDEQNVKWFFADRINNWDTLIGYINLGVSDVLVCEEICFELDKIAEVAHRAGAEVRVFANVAQSQYRDTPALKKFFIRPEDIEAYEPYVDIIEFYGKDTNKIDTYFKIYNKDERWYGKLDEIIMSFDSDLDSRYTIPRFAEKRIRCGKECLKGGRCQICERIEKLSKNLEKANLLVMIDKKKEVQDGEGSDSESRSSESNTENISE